jgi:DNA-binding response OmpR family regulator
MRILIVDDEPVSLTALQQLVEKLHDCHAQGFTQASAALAWAVCNEPDLLIVGYVMPELNGIEFTEKFRALCGRAETPVLMVTASTDREIRSAAFRHGVNDFLTKPYDAVELQARVRNLLLLRSKQDNLHSPPSIRPGGTFTLIPDQAAGLGLLDLDMTLRRLAGDVTLLGQVARVFIRTVPQLLSAIASALAAEDLERAYAEAHSLKGAVAVFEAPQVFDAVVSVEAHAIDYNGSGAAAAFSAARALIERLVAELQPLATPSPRP